MSDEPIDLAVARDQRAVGLVAKRELADRPDGARDRCRMTSTQQHERDAQGDGDVLFHASPIAVEEQVDDLDADERHDHAADAVEQQVAAQDAAAPSGRYSTPRSASGTSAMMTSALKMTAERIALCGVASRMTLSACSSRIAWPGTAPG